MSFKRAYIHYVILSFFDQSMSFSFTLSAQDAWKKKAYISPL